MTEIMIFFEKKGQGKQGCRCILEPSRVRGKKEMIVVFTFTGH